MNEENTYRNDSKKKMNTGTELPQQKVITQIRLLLRGVCQRRYYVLPGSALFDFLIVKTVNPLYTGRLFHCFMLDESICHCRYECQVYFVTFILFLIKILLANTVDPDQTPHYVASDLVLHCLPMTFLRVSR